MESTDLCAIRAGCCLLTVDFIHFEDDAVVDPGFSQQDVQLARHAAGHCMENNEQMSAWPMCARAMTSSVHQKPVPGWMPKRTVISFSRSVLTSSAIAYCTYIIAILEFVLYTRLQ